MQPIVEIATGALFAAEALARFPARPSESLDAIFAAAHKNGSGAHLEARCLEAALSIRPTLPAGLKLSVNISPNVLSSDAVRQCWPTDLDNLIVEITEHEAQDSDRMSREISRLRQRGAAIAIDDVTTGYAGLLRLATLRPDYVKIDRQVVDGVGNDEAKTAVLECLVALSHRLGAAVIVEGVECLDDLATLASMDVDYVQGFAVGHPAPAITPIPPEIASACTSARRALLFGPAINGGTATHALDMHSVTASLASARKLPDLGKAIARAAAQLRVDIISISILTDSAHLLELAVTGDELDPVTYAVSEFPATYTTVNAGTVSEAHANDPHSDPAEVRLLRLRGYASLLIVPLLIGQHCIGILELAHRTERRWTSRDLADGRGLAEHLSHTILELADQRGQVQLLNARQKRRKRFENRVSQQTSNRMDASSLHSVRQQTTPNN